MFNCRHYNWKQAACIIISILLFFGCADDNKDSSSSSSSTTYSIGGTVTGLSGVFVIQNNGADDTVIEQTGADDVSFAFQTRISSGNAYSVTVKLQPNTQTCTVSNGSGTTSNKNVSNITISCTSSSYSVTGTVSGLTGTVVLQNNGF